MANREEDDRGRGGDFELSRGYFRPGREHGDPREDQFGRGFEQHEPGRPLEHVHERAYSQPYDRWRPRDYVFYSGEGYHREFIEPHKAAGRYAGRGPRNYTRPDARILEDVNERLTEHPDIDATHIEATVENGEVTLQGWVPDRDSRLLAEDLAWSIRGVANVNNHLRADQRVRQIPILPGQRERRGGGSRKTHDRPSDEKTQRAPERPREEGGDVGTRGPESHSGSGVLGSTDYSDRTREASTRPEDADARRNRTP
jgi:hypothetical protein